MQNLKQRENWNAEGKRNDTGNIIRNNEAHEKKLVFTLQNKILCKTKKL